MRPRPPARPTAPPTVAWFALGALFLAVGCRPGAPPGTLTLAHSLDVGHPVHAAMERLAARVQERSGGRLRITLYPGGQLGSERELIELVQLGAIDLVKTSTSPLESFVPGMAVFSLPYLFRDEAHFWRVLDGPVGQEILDLGLAQGLKGLCYYDAGSRSFYTRARAIESPGDLRGLKIRVQNSRTSVRLIESMGGAATPIAFGELYTALDQGVVDGAENNPPSFLNSRHYEVCRFYSLDEHTRVPDIVLISAATWRRLDPEQQTWLREAARDSVHFQRDLWERTTRENLDQLARAGVRILHPDKAAFQEAVRDLYREARSTEAGRWMDAILNHP